MESINKNIKSDKANEYTECPECGSKKIVFHGYNAGVISWGCFDCSALWYPVRSESVSTSVEVAKNCPRCMLRVTLPATCVSGCNDSHGLSQCSNCKFRFHECKNGVTEVTKPHRDGHYRCTSCYLASRVVEYKALSKRLEDINTQLQVPGYICPACGTIDWREATVNGESARICRDESCLQIWHACPSEPGVILCKVPDRDLKCVFCHPMKDTDVEEDEDEAESVACPICGECDPVSSCGCDEWDKCGHYRCSKCDLTWHYCNSTDDEPLMRRSVGPNAHIYCKECRGKKWMTRLLLDAAKVRRAAKKEAIKVSKP